MYSICVYTNVGQLGSICQMHKCIQYPYNPYNNSVAIHTHTHKYIYIQTYKTVCTPEPYKRGPGYVGKLLRTKCKHLHFARF